MQNVTPSPSAGVASRILVATDLSDPADEAIREADGLARVEGAVLAVCHAMPSSGVHMLFPQLYAREATDAALFVDRVRTLVVERVARVTGRSPDAFEVFVERGTEYAEVVRRAEDWGATLLVVGSHGKTGHASPRRLGGVATRVVRHAHAPVLVVRPRLKTGLVAFATDLSPPSLCVLPTAVAHARLRRAKLVVLHVIDQGAPLASVGPSEGITPLVLSPELLDDLRSAARAKIAASLADLGAEAESTILEGAAASSILAFIEEREPELAVVGTRGRTGLARVVLGSVAEHVARAALTSVLVVRVVP